MNSVRDYIFLVKQIDLAQKINGLIYYAKMIPWLGKFIKDRWYTLPSLKRILSWLWFLGSLLVSFGMRFAYVMIMLNVLMHMLLGWEQKEAVLAAEILGFIMLSGFAGPFLINHTTSPQKKEYVMIHLMHMNARIYTFARWVMEIGISALMILLSLGIMFMIQNDPIWYAIPMTMFYMVMHFLGECFYIRYIKKLDKNYLYVLIVFIITYGIAYGLPALKITFTEASLYMVVAMGILSIPIGMFVYRDLRNVDYTTVLREGIIKNRDIYSGLLMKEAKVSDVKLKDKDYSEEELRSRKYEGKRGYEYLNAIFFQRHKRLFYRPMRNRILGIFLVFTLINLCVIVLGKDIMQMSDPLVMVPSLLFILYFISIGERVTRAMFYNCDVSLLHYGYYRQPKAILTNFKIRLRKLIFMNVFLAVLLCIGFLSVLVIGKMSFPPVSIALFIVSIFSMAIFFSVHHLCMYYILQPYTGELESKSPMFNVINSVVYFICYMAFRLDGNMFFALLLVVVTIGYSLLALLLVYRLAPKNFHIR